MRDDMHRNRIPLLLLLMLGNLWGLSFSLSKLAVTGGVNPIAYAWWQSTGASLFLFLMCRRAGIRLPTGRRHLLLYCATGLAGLALPNVNIVMTAQYLPAGVLATLVTTVPLMTFAMAVALGDQRFSFWALCGLSFGAVGVLLLIGPTASLPDPSAAAWVPVAMITPVLYATSTILAARLRPPGTPSLAAAWGLVTAASIMLLPVMLATGTFRPLFADGITPADSAMAGQIVITCIAYVLYFEIIDRAGPVYVSQVGYIVNVFGLLWGFVVFAEVPSPWLWATVGLVFAGVYLVHHHNR